MWPRGQAGVLGECTGSVEVKGWLTHAKSVTRFLFIIIFFLRTREN